MMEKYCILVVKPEVDQSASLAEVITGNELNLTDLVAQEVKGEGSYLVNVTVEVEVLQKYS